jgi:ABC-type sugar transport system ATPase subunit
VALAVGGLTLRAGEIVGLAGLEGQGQDEYLKALRLASANVPVAYVARDRREESIFPPLSVRENFAAATLAQDSDRTAAPPHQLGPSGTHGKPDDV